MKVKIFNLFFGDKPEWANEYKKSSQRLHKYGFDIVTIDDLDLFSNLVREKLQIEPHIVPGTCNASNLRPALGLVLSDYLDGYDLWGYTDYDVVYGRLDKFITPELMKDVDVFGNDPGHLCGPFSLFRNNEKIKNLFKEHPGWQEIMSDMAHHAFDEQGMSDVVNRLAKEGKIKVEYRFWQGHDPNTIKHLKMVGDSLYDGKDEIMMFHFNRKIPKEWPIK